MELVVVEGMEIWGLDFGHICAWRLFWPQCEMYTSRRAL
jgi:hypothetical protein